MRNLLLAVSKYIFYNFSTILPLKQEKAL
jgi:hypothetical protein